MKLRNKKTGEIWDIGKVLVNDYPCWETLTQICEDWEDVPVEPLIKDEKIREIVRPWAKVNGATDLKYYEGENCLEDIFRNEIHFNQTLGLEDAKTYTTEELCGTPEPTGSLIKDEKIRKAVRAWAEVNSIKTALYSERPNKSLCQLTDMGDEDYDIQFVGWIPTLKDGKEYTIDELCGEEEE